MDSCLSVENEQSKSRRPSVGLLTQPLPITGNNGEETHQHPAAKKLSPLEKRYLLAAEHGDVPTVKTILEKSKTTASFSLDVNCIDPLGRTAIRMAIDNENLDMLETLLNMQVHPKDGLLHAVNAEYVEAVEMLIDYEEKHHKEGKPYSWEVIEPGLATFTTEITPLILAAHKDNYEILKLLLDRGASLPMVHGVKCGCRQCKIATAKDSLKHSRSRISSYRALASPSLICLSSLDPILTAFELSYELRKLSLTENEFKHEYLNLQKQCQKFATDLVDQVRNSQELETVLAYDGAPVKDKNQRNGPMTLPRIDMAIKYKQKTFIAHANVQQLLMTIWYGGMSEFRRKSSLKQFREILNIGVLFPLYACLYMICPTSQLAKRIRKPFFKFITHSFSYLFFLLLLILASQRVESLIVELLGTEDMKLKMKDELRKQRGQIPTITEFAILIFVIAHVFEEAKEVWRIGVVEYFANMWNMIDNIRNTLYITTISLRTWAFIQERSEAFINPDSVYIPRESWDTFDPNLIADGCFAAGNIFAALKLVHMFSINQYLGPLQVSLGRMVIDIIKFFFIYTLVLFAFACGMNQLMWYYADLERQKCQSLPGGESDWERHRDSCMTWRRFSNLFESSQTLFWASFGLIDIGNFDLSGIKDYTRFWGLLMFGSYSVINVVVLLNLLIAMMSNSYHIISVRSDVEWKFARTKLFLNYFEEGGTLPPPFNCLPNVKHLLRICCKNKDDELSEKEKTNMEDELNYQIVMRNLVWRYITERQHQLEMRSVTEDDINEIRQDINSFRYQMLDVFQNNGMDTTNIRPDRIETSGKKIKIRERRLLKDFSISLVDDAKKEQVTNDEAIRQKFQELNKIIGNKNTAQRSSVKWRELIFSGGSPIGKTKIKHSLVKTDSLKKTLEQEISLQLQTKLRKKSRSLELIPNLGGTLGQETKQQMIKEPNFESKKVESIGHDSNVLQETIRRNPHTVTAYIPCLSTIGIRSTFVQSKNQTQPANSETEKLISESPEQKMEHEAKLSKIMAVKQPKLSEIKVKVESPKRIANQDPKIGEVKLIESNATPTLEVKRKTESPKKSVTQEMKLTKTADIQNPKLQNQILTKKPQSPTKISQESKLPKPAESPKKISPESKLPKPAVFQKPESPKKISPESKLSKPAVSQQLESPKKITQEPKLPKPAVFKKPESPKSITQETKLPNSAVSQTLQTPKKMVTEEPWATRHAPEQIELGENSVKDKLKMYETSISQSPKKGLDQESQSSAESEANKKPDSKLPRADRINDQTSSAKTQTQDAKFPLKTEAQLDSKIAKLAEKTLLEDTKKLDKTVLQDRKTLENITPKDTKLPEKVTPQDSKLPRKTVEKAAPKTFEKTSASDTKLPEKRTPQQPQLSVKVTPQETKLPKKPTPQEPKLPEKPTPQEHKLPEKPTPQEHKLPENIVPKDIKSLDLDFMPGVYRFPKITKSPNKIPLDATPSDKNISKDIKSPKKGIAPMPPTLKLTVTQESPLEKHQVTQPRKTSLHEKRNIPEPAIAYGRSRQTSLQHTQFRNTSPIPESKFLKTSPEHIELTPPKPKSQVDSQTTLEIPESPQKILETKTISKDDTQKSQAAVTLPEKSKLDTKNKATDIKLQIPESETDYDKKAYVSEDTDNIKQRKDRQIISPKDVTIDLTSARTKGSEQASPKETRYHVEREKSPTRLAVPRKLSTLSSPSPNEEYGVNLNGHISPLSGRRSPKWF